MLHIMILNLMQLNNIGFSYLLSYYNGIVGNTSVAEWRINFTYYYIALILA